MPTKLQMIFMNATIALLIAILTRLFLEDQSTWKTVWEQAINGANDYNREMTEYLDASEHTNKMKYYYIGDK